MPSTKFRMCERFARNDLVEKKNQKLQSFDKQDIISASQVAFEGEIKHAQYCVQKKRLDFYFSEHKLGVEID